MITIQQDGTDIHRIVIDGRWILLDSKAITAEIIERTMTTVLKFKDGTKVSLDDKNFTSVYNLNEYEYQKIAAVVKLNEGK